MTVSDKEYVLGVLNMMVEILEALDQEVNKEFTLKIMDTAIAQLMEWCAE